MEGVRSFVRPSSVPKGVWGKYSTFRIEDIPDERREDAIKHMIDNFFKDEPLSTVAQKTDPYTNEDMHGFLRNAMIDNISLIAVDEANNDEIAGVTVLRVVSRCDPHRYDKLDSKLQSMQKLFAFLEYCHEGLDLFTYDSGTTKVIVDHVLEPMGLSVSPQYRGKGIGQALITARHKLAATVGIGATQGIYTSIYSQAIIKRHPGMSLIKDVPYANYVEDGKVKFASLNPPHPSAQVIGGLLPEQTA